MANKRYFNIDATVEVPAWFTFDEFETAFGKFIEQNSWTYGGGIVELDEEGNQIKSED
jgi:hypothetical protein